MHRSHGHSAMILVILTTLLTAFSTGCGGAHGGLRYASDVDDLRRNVNLTFRIDAIGPRPRPFGPRENKGGMVNWFGTGTVIHESGILLTNKHVIEGATELSIAILEHGKTVYYPANVVVVADEHDLAVVKIERTFDSAVTLADDDDAAMLVNVYTAGFPRNIAMTGARGEIARVGVTDDEGGDVKDDMLVYIEGGPGSSGSGIFLTDGGELVGVVKKVMIHSERSNALLGALVAEPISHVRSFLTEKKIPFND